MKQAAALLLILTLSAVIPVASHAQSGDMPNRDSGKKPPAGAQEAHKATGVVKKVDSRTGTVTLAHDPVKSLNWPAMTMGFTVKETALFDKLAVDRKVEFEFVQRGKDYVITAVK
jgi:Cu/Ag efflux protein CusF